jgi:divalent metal cation (Fe/Co/Zn/Cd) transporter
VADAAPKLTRYAWLSIAASLSTVALKAAAWALTTSVGLLSDALESLVNVGAAVMLLSMLRIATRPADEGHAYGHSKAEYFASGFEGACSTLERWSTLEWVSASPSWPPE